MPKRKQTLNKQYAPKRKKDDDADSITDEEEENTTEVGQLYSNEKTNLVQRNDLVLYIGKKKFTIKNNQTHIDVMNDYIINVINDTCGYITSKDIGVKQLLNDPSKVISHMFISCLDYNLITVPSNIKIYNHDDEMFLGEAIYYSVDYEKGELGIHVSSLVINRFLKIKDVHTINFDKHINNNNFVIKNTLNRDNENIVINTDVYNILIALFTLADHAATHYITEVTNGHTDWINHYNYGKNISSYTTLNTLFKISATISLSNLIPRLTVSSNTSKSSVIDFLYPQPALSSIIPIESATNVANVLNGFNFSDVG